MLRRLGEEARARRPDAFVAIDFPDFNFRLLPVMKRLGVPVVYYVSPQLWAWRPGRLDTIRKYVDRMLVIFPFETRMYEKAGVPVEFVGHPLVDLAVPDKGSPTSSSPDWASTPPGRSWRSSRAAVRTNCVIMLSGLVGAARLVAERVPGVQFVVARAPALDDALFQPIEIAARGAHPGRARWPASPTTCWPQPTSC